MDTINRLTGRVYFAENLFNNESIAQHFYGIVYGVNRMPNVFSTEKSRAYLKAEIKKLVAAEHPYTFESIGGRTLEKGVDLLVIYLLDEKKSANAWLDKWNKYYDATFWTSGEATIYNSAVAIGLDNAGYKPPMRGFTR